jgi:hypothetical protein
MPLFASIGNCPNGDRPDLVVQAQKLPATKVNKCGLYLATLRFIPCDL